MTHNFFPSSPAISNGVKYITIISASILLTAPFVTHAAIGASCTSNAGCNTAAGEYCDTTDLTCYGGAAPAGSTQTTNTGTQTTSGGGYIPIAPIPGLTDSQTVGSATGDLAKFFNNLYIFLIGLAAALAVIMIIIGGIQYATTDNVSKKSDGRARIQQAILGLILILLPVLVFTLINPSILNLSLKWSAIDLDKSGSFVGNSTATSGLSPSTPTAVTGCTQQNGPVSGTVLVTCTAQTSAAADSALQQYFNQSCTNMTSRGFPTVGTNPTQTYDPATGATQVSNSAYQKIGWCSSSVSAQVVWNANIDISPSLIKMIGTLSNGSYITSCSGRWVIRGTEPISSVVIGGSYTPPGTPFTCPTTDPAFETIVRAAGGSIRPYCTTVTVHCEYQ